VSVEWISSGMGCYHQLTAESAGCLEFWTAQEITPIYGAKLHGECSPRSAPSFRDASPHHEIYAITKFMRQRKTTRENLEDDLTPLKGVERPFRPMDVICALRELIALFHIEQSCYILLFFTFCGSIC
jgi:hypothetical protein